MRTIKKIQDEGYIDLVISDTAIPLYAEDDNITSMIEEHSILHLKIEELDLCMLGRYPYYMFPSIYTLNSEISLEKSNVTAIQQNSFFSLFGQGIVVGIVDTGIDYQHPAFKNADNTTRISHLWDQTILTGTPPEGYSYGAEYLRGKINVAIRDSDPLSIVPSTDENGHGTMLAGIAAGSPNEAEQFRGIVPEAELVVVKMKQAKKHNRAIFGIAEDVVCYQETDLILGISYVVEVARKLQKPLALCVGLGTNRGAHDSQGVVSSYLEGLAQSPNIGVVVAGGNEGNTRRHFYGKMETGVSSKTVELNIGSADKNFSMEIWQNMPQLIAIEVTSPTGEAIERVLPTLSECRKFDLVFESSVVWINNIILEEVTGDQMILIRFQNAMQGVWKFNIVNLDGMQSEFNVWLPAGDIISDETFLLDSTAEVTLTSPGNSRYAMVTTAYNQNDDSILLRSSQGYTRTGTIKPDFAAPGYQLTCPLPGGGYGSATGTGAAAAHTTGVAAMLMEWAIYRGHYTTISSRELNRVLIRGARRQENIEYPNRIWGYGQIDLLGTFQSLS